MTDSLPPLIEPNGRFSHIRLSEFGRVCALPRAPSIRVDEDEPRDSVSPCGAISRRSLLTSEQVSRLRSTPVTGASSLLRLFIFLSFQPRLAATLLRSCPVVNNQIFLFRFYKDAAPDGADAAGKQQVFHP